jgi:exodeoxyribonuclease V beta subunit
MTTIRYPKPEILTEIALDEHAVIEASAGTGKTYTIERLVVELLLNGPPSLRIDDVLIVTFTRRATSELRERIRAMLRDIVDHVDRGDSPEEALEEAEAHWEIGEDGARSIREAIYDFDRAPIYTIHGFCQRILSEYAFENRRLFDEEHAEASRLFERCFRELLRTRLSTDPDLKPWLEAWLNVGKSVEDLQSELYDLQGAREVLRPRMEPETMARLREEARAGEIDDKSDRYRVEAATLQTMRPVVEEAFRDFKDAEGVYVYDDMLELVWESLQGPQGPELVESIRDRFRYGLIDEFQDTDPLQWQIFERIFYESGGRNVFYLIGDPKQAIYGFRGADVGAYLEAARRVSGDDPDPLVLEHNYRSTENLVGAYNAIFDQQADPPFFDHDEITYDHPVDCGQPELFLEGERGESQSAISLVSLQAASSDENVKVGEMRRAIRESMADEIARIVGGETPLYVPTDDGEGRRPIRENDIFVLTPKQKRGEEVGDALRERGIRYAFYRKSGLFQTDEAREIFKVLRAVAQPDDRSHRFHAYRTPFFAGSLPELEALDDLEGPRSPRRLLRKWHAMARRRDFDRLFQHLLEESGLLRRAVLLNKNDRALTNYRHILEILTRASHRSDRDLDELLGLLHTYVEGDEEPEEDDAKLQRLESEEEAVQIMTIHKSKGLEAELVFLYGGFGKSTKARRTYKEPDGQKVRFWRRGIMTDEQKARGNTYYYRAAQRLMYVAITRARSRVYLPYVSPEIGDTDRSSKIKGEYRPVVRRLDAIVSQLPESYPDRYFEIQTVSTSRSSRRRSPDRPHRALDEWSIPEPTALERRSDRWFRRRCRENKLRITSFSGLASEGGAGSRVVGDDPGSEPREEDDIFEDDDWITDVEGPPPGRQTGSLLHEWLERIDYDVVAEETFETWRQRPEVRGLVRETMRDYGVAETHRRDCEELVYRALTLPVAPEDGPFIERLADVDRHRCEVAFHYPIPEPHHPDWNEHHAPDVEVDEGFVTGEIDLLFEHDGRIYFADWKSNLLEDYDAETVAADVREHYELQARLYAIAVVKMLGISSAEAYERFGGFFYLYLRGLDADDPTRGVVYDRPEWDAIGTYWQGLEQLSR